MILYQIACDACGEVWGEGNSKSLIYKGMEKEGWFIQCGVIDCHYCPDCFDGLDEDDKIILRESCKC